MAEAIDVYDRDISNALDTAEEHLGDAQKADGHTREEYLMKAKEELKRSKKSTHELKSHLRQHPELAPKKMAATRKILKSFEAAQNKLHEKISTYEESSAGLGQGYGYGGGGAAEAEYVDEDPSRGEARKLAGQVTKHQKTTVSSIARTEKLIAQTEEVGQNIVQNLDEQGEKLNRIDEDLDALGTDIQRARKELNAFARRMASDRLILCCMFLIVVGGLVGIILHFVLPKEDTGNNGVLPPVDQ